MQRFYVPIYDSQIVHPTPNVSNPFILHICLMIVNQMGKITKNNIFRRFVLYYIYIYIYIYMNVVHLF